MPTPRSASQPRRGPGRPPGGGARLGREALLRAARALMAERGLPRVTLREVARRAGVRPALVNYYFGGKEGLLRAVTTLVGAEARERVREATTGEGSAAERLVQLIRGIVDAFAADPYAPRLLFEQIFFAEAEAVESFVENVARPNALTLSKLLADGNAAGELREVDPRFFVPALIGAILLLFLAQPIAARVFGIERVTPELADSFADSVAELILYGITPREPS